MKRYLVLAMRTPSFTADVVAPHRAFLEVLRAEQRIELSGAFSDATGGAYIVRASSLAEATAIAHRDPLHVSGASVLQIHEWNAV